MKRMKETLLGLVVIAVFVATLMACNYIEHHYTREQCEVLAVNGTLVEVESPAKLSGLRPEELAVELPYHHL